MKTWRRYLEAALEEGDASLFAAALGDIARAKGMSQLARETGLGRESLYKALSPSGNPEFATILRVVSALGLQLHATRASIKDGAKVLAAEPSNFLMPTPTSPVVVVQRQLDAFNAKDVSAWLSTYAPDAEQFTLHGERLAAGREEIGARIASRFTEPDLHAEVLARTVTGNFVVDHELIRRNFPEGIGTVEMLCVYEVVNGYIQRASFALGEKKLSVPTKSATTAPVGR